MPLSLRGSGGDSCKKDTNSGYNRESTRERKKRRGLKRSLLIAALSALLLALFTLPLAAEPMGPIEGEPTPEAEVPPPATPVTPYGLASPKLWIPQRATACPACHPSNPALPRAVEH